MAKIGEGDPRWLVTERADGTNVNNWHWVEKDAMPWCQQRLPQLVAGMSLAQAEGSELKITGVDSISGEAIINNRKQKIIPSYELEIKLNWEGSVDGTQVKGKIHLPYVADENHDEDPELRFASEKDDAASRKLKEQFLQGPGKKALIEAIHKFVSELRAGGPALSSSSTAGTAGATAGTAASSAAPKQKLSSADADEVRAAATASTAKAAAANGTGASKSKGSSKSGRSLSLSLTEQFYCRAADIFECFTVEGRVKAFTQSNASIEPRVGGRFTWFGGSVEGEFTELEPGKRIVMKWRFNTWEDGCLSKVVMDLEEPEPGHTFAKLSQTGIPESDRYNNEDVLDSTEKGWKVQIFQRIRQIFGYGLGL